MNLELLNEVLKNDLFTGEKIISIDFSNIDKQFCTSVDYETDEYETPNGFYVGSTRNINIFELCQKIRIWAVSKGFNIDSRTFLSNLEAHPEFEENTPMFDLRVEGVEIGYEDRGEVCLAEFDHDPRLEFEYKAIIQAAEWIFNYLNTNKRKYKWIQE